jgi:hypothetical protein
MAKTKTYRIPVSWSVMATIEVEAKSLAEAIEEADNRALPTDPEYIDGSFEVNRSFITAVNENLSEKDLEECE